jgi:hypothetical protein
MQFLPLTCRIAGLEFEKLKKAIAIRLVKIEDRFLETTLKDRALEIKLQRITSRRSKVLKKQTMIHQKWIKLRGEADLLKKREKEMFAYNLASRNDLDH